MAEDHINTLALAAGNGAMLAFVVQNALDAKIAPFDATRIAAVVVTSLLASFVCLALLNLQKVPVRLLSVLQGVAVGGILFPPVIWIVRAWQP